MTLETMSDAGLNPRSTWSEGLRAGAIAGVVLAVGTAVTTMFFGASLTGMFASTRLGVGMGAGLTTYAAVSGFVASLLQGLLIGIVCGASGGLAYKRRCLEVGGVVGLLWLGLSRFVSAFPGSNLALRLHQVSSVSHDDVFEAMFMGAAVAMMCHFFSGIAAESTSVEGATTTASEGLNVGLAAGVGFGLVSAVAALFSFGSLAAGILIGIKALVEGVLVGAICGAGDSLTSLKKAVRLGALFGIFWTLATKFTGLGGPTLAGGLLEGAFVAFLCNELYVYRNGSLA
jgi:hypothetical protein